MRTVLLWLGLVEVPPTSEESDDPRLSAPAWRRLLRRLNVTGQVLLLLAVCAAGGAAGSLAVDVAEVAARNGLRLLGVQEDQEQCWYVRERTPTEEPLRT